MLLLPHTHRPDGAGIKAAVRPLLSCLQVVLAPPPTAAASDAANTCRALLPLLLQMPSQNQIGEYKLIELAGEGSFGKVCRWPWAISPPSPPACPRVFRHPTPALPCACTA